MKEERLKVLMDQVGMPESVSLYLALTQLANEIEQEVVERCASKVEHILRLGGGTFGDYIRKHL